MKKVELERVAIVKALERAPNITQAARDLGAARRTLQSRMRDYNMAPGESGRPRHLLPKRSFMFMPALSNALLVGVAFGLGWLWWRRKSSIVGAGKTVDLLGLDAII